MHDLWPRNTFVVCARSRATQPPTEAVGLDLSHYQFSAKQHKKQTTHFGKQQVRITANRRPQTPKPTQIPKT
eukprot:57083-Eustigmatos_ZCMA.PRE.1